MVNKTINHLHHGFTLVELIISIGLLATVGSIAVIILFTTLKGANKGDVMRDVKQNGEYAISVMEMMVRNAQEIVTVDSVNCESPAAGCVSSGTCLKIKNPDNKFTSFSSETVGSIGKIASNSGNYITNNKVTASNLRFTCTQSSGAPPLITISFSLSQANLTTTRPEERASIPFKTTVSLRTY